MFPPYSFFATLLRSRTILLGIVLFPAVAFGVRTAVLFGPATNSFSSYGMEDWQEMAANADLLATLQLVERGEYDTALTTAHRVLLAHPSSSAAHELLGVVLAKRGQLEDALREFDLAAKLAPTRSTPWTKMGDIHLANQNPAQAKSCLLQAVARNPEDYRAHQRLGLIFEEEENIPLAMDHWEKGIIGPPADYIGVKVNLASLYNQTGQYQRTINLLQDLIHEDTPNPAAHFALGTAYLGMKRAPDAVASFASLRAFDPNPVRARLAQGMAYRQTGDFEKSFAELDGVVHAKPDWWLAHYELGETLLALEKTSEARQHFSAAAEHCPHPVVPRNRIADSLAVTGQWDAAAEAYEKILDEGIADWHTYRGLATAYQRSSRQEEAETILKQACEKLSTPEAFLRLGLHYGYTKQYQQARNALTQAATLSPADPRVLKALSGIQLRTGDRERAIETARSLLHIVPDSVEDRCYLGALLEEAEDFAAAAEEYEHVLKLNPTHLLTLNNLAMVQMKLGNQDEALRRANQALALAPDNPSILDTVGWILFNQAEFSRASAALEKAVVGAQSNPTHHYHLAACYAKLGQRDKARQQCEVAVNSPLAFSARQDAEKLLQQLN